MHIKYWKQVFPTMNWMVDEHVLCCYACSMDMFFTVCLEREQTENTCNICRYASISLYKALKGL